MRRPLLPVALVSLLGLPPLAVRAEDAPPPPATPTAAEPPPEPPAEPPTKPAAEAPAKAPDAAAADAPAEKPTKPAPKTVEATRGRFVVPLELSGVLEPVGAVEVAFEPEAWGGELEVVEAFAGGPVTAGQVLVRLSTEKLDEALAAAERDVEIARRTLARQQEDARKAQEASDGNLARARFERERADKALARFTGTERAIRKEESELRVRGTEDAVRDQEEELAQLKKMYDAGDGVQETEEIVLKRATRQLERTRRALEFQRARSAYHVDVELADEARGLELGARREALELARAEAGATLALEQGRLELARAEAGFRKQEKALADLRKDRERMVLTAPAAGLAVPGGVVRGRWQGVEETRKELEKGGKLRAKTPIFTIVTPGKVVVRTAVPEGKVLAVAPGQAATVKPTADAKAKLAGRVATVSPVGGDGGFPVTVELVDADARLLPGFTVKLEVVVREADGVVTVPAKSVVGDEDDRAVHVVGADGEPTRVKVRLGDAAGGRVEVTEGLAGGERVLESPPK